MIGPVTVGDFKNGSSKLVVPWSDVANSFCLQFGHVVTEDPLGLSESAGEFFLCGLVPASVAIGLETKKRKEPEGAVGQ